MARALYIHWPFCLKKCPYCDFNSHVRDGVDVDAWRSALLADLRHEAELTGEEQLASIFFGGGTPSLMPPSLVDTLLKEAERLWGFAPEIEITLEANPSSVEAANFKALSLAGVNRVSLGIQALDDETLRFLGRLHSADEALAALELAQDTFGRVSFDLIYARPNQTTEEWEAELGRAISFGTSHLSLYQLTIEPNTRFATEVRLGNFTPLEDDPAADLFEVTRNLTDAAGIPAYEISNHARPGEESRHNLAYWRYQDYVGIGPGAHGRRNQTATRRHKKPENFLDAVSRNGHGLAEERVLGRREMATEALLMGLRLREGISLASLAQRFGIDDAELVDKTKFKLLSSHGLVWENGRMIGVTSQGMPVLDALLGELVPESLAAA